MKVQELMDSAPAWAHWIGIVGTAALSWIQPLAGVVAILWGCLQIYGWFEKRSNKSRNLRRRVGDRL